MTTTVEQRPKPKLKEGAKGFHRSPNSQKTVEAPQTRSHSPLISQKGILIGDDWKIGTDPMNVVLYRKVKSQAGKAERWQVHGYYSTVGAALIGLVRQGVRDTELKDVKTVQNKIAELEHAILKIEHPRN